MGIYEDQDEVKQEPSILCANRMSCPSTAKTMGMYTSIIKDVKGINRYSEQWKVSYRECMALK